VKIKGFGSTGNLVDSELLGLLGIWYKKESWWLKKIKCCISFFHEEKDIYCDKYISTIENVNCE
jgi:hypothetical protein